MIFIGIDPGLEGAIAVYNPTTDKVLSVHDIPTRDRAYGTGLEVNWTKLSELLLQLTEGEEVLIVLENVGPMPKQGVTSSFSFGQTTGGIRAIIEMTCVEYILIHPVTWKKLFALVGSTKGTTLEMVRNAYPDLVHILSRKKDHNRAEAIAIAVAGYLHTRGKK